MPREPRVDRGSETWEAVEAEAEKRIHKLRLERESTGADMRDLDRALGAINELRKLLDLPNRQANPQPREIKQGGPGFTAPRVALARNTQPENTE